MLGRKPLLQLKYLEPSRRESQISIVVTPNSQHIRLKKSYTIDVHGWLKDACAEDAVSKAKQVGDEWFDTEMSQIEIQDSQQMIEARDIGIGTGSVFHY